MAGVSRSASVVTAHIMKSERRILEDALAEVKGARPIVDPNPGFRRQLQAFEARLRPFFLFLPPLYLGPIGMSIQI